MASKRSDFGDGASPGKIFIGGLAKDTTIDTFVKYFGKYGEITDSVIMKDRATGRPRGFGFITYADPSVVDTVIVEPHVINGKQVEIKRTIPKGSDEFKEFFSKFGKVVEHEIIRDHVTKRSRGFGFIVFESDQTVDEILVNGNMIDMNGTQVEIKKAEPKKSSNPGSHSYNREPKRGYVGDSYDGFDDSYNSYGPRTGNYGPPPPYRSYPGGFPSRFADYGPYGPGAGEYNNRYADYANDYSGYRSGEPSLNSYSSRFSSYNSGPYGTGYTGSAIGGFGRGSGASSYASYAGPGGSAGYESVGGYESGTGYGAPGGPYGNRAGYSGGSRYHPYSR